MMDARKIGKSVPVVAAAMALACAAGPLRAAPGDGQGSSRQAGSDRGSAGANGAAARPMNNNAAASAGAAISHTGGSLLKASLAVNADPAQAKLSQLSFFAVPDKEPKTLKKHDLITIIVREDSNATSKGLTDTKKNAELKAEIQQMVRLKLGKGELIGLPTPSATPGIDFTGERNFHGEGEVDRSDTFTARVTAEIVDVKPNGTVIVQARKHIKTDDEDQLFLMSGIFRAEDVTPDNTVLSTQIYDLNFQKISKGDVRSTTERGRLPKLLDFVNIF